MLRELIADSHSEPTEFLNEEGEKEIHRIIFTCFKMDTQEYADFTRTKNINKDMKYGCAKCNDLSTELMDPNRYSHQYPRGTEQILQIAGFDERNDDDCITFKDWKNRGRGYIPCDFDMLPAKFEPDPSYVITTDIAHAAKNLGQQLFVTLMATETEFKDRALSLFQDMISICNLNNIPVPLTMKNWTGSPGFLKDISLELAPTLLVKLCVTT